MCRVRCPSPLSAIILACTIQTARAWTLCASLRTWRSSVASSGGRAVRCLGMGVPSASQPLAHLLPLMRNDALESVGGGRQPVLRGHSLYRLAFSVDVNPDSTLATLHRSGSVARLLNEQLE